MPAASPAGLARLTAEAEQLSQLEFASTPMQSIIEVNVLLCDLIAINLLYVFSISFTLASLTFCFQLI